MNKISYIKCPRCDLNYIDSRQDKCDICMAELGLAPNILIDDELEDDVVKELCPICKRTFINFDQEICDKCASAKLSVDDIGVLEDDDSWRSYLDDEEAPVDSNEKLEIPLEELKDEEYDATFDEEEDELVDAVDEFEDELDFDYGNLDDYDDDDDDDFDDDDDEE